LPPLPLSSPESRKSLLQLPLPGDLPTSLAFRPRPGEPWALDPVYARGFRDKAAPSDLAREFVRSKGGRCEGCGLRRGSLYRAELYDAQGRLVRVERRVSRGGQAAHRGNDPSRCRPEDLICLCPICHGHADAVHRWSAAALTRAADPLGTRLTRVSRDQWLSRGREAVRQGGLPALGVGGADLLVAHGLDLGLPATPPSLRCLVPELTGVPEADLRAVIGAALVRLRMRGLLAREGDRLQRPLCLPAAVTETPPDPRRPGG
ncbi:hypothetical protein QOL99_06050, partial [Deinococcus sp. MIMF12]